MVEATATVAVGAGDVTAPLRVMVCIVPVTFRLLSVRISEPLTVPLARAVGEKLMGSVQVAPAASVAAVVLLLVNSGQAVAPVLSSVK